MMAQGKLFVSRFDFSGSCGGFELKDRVRIDLEGWWSIFAVRHYYNAFKESSSQLLFVTVNARPYGLQDINTVLREVAWSTRRWGTNSLKVTTWDH